MRPQEKRPALLVVLFVPYGIAVGYLALLLPDRIPLWAQLGSITYLLGAALLYRWQSKRIPAVEPPKRDPAPNSVLDALRAWGLYLILVWTAMFVYGAYQTLRDRIPLDRAFFGGTIALYFIVAFSLSLRRKPG